MLFRSGKNTEMGSQPFLSPGDPLDPGMELRSPALQADSLLSELPGKPIESPSNILSHRSALGRCLSPPWVPPLLVTTLPEGSEGQADLHSSSLVYSAFLHPPYASIIYLKSQSNRIVGEVSRIKSIKTCSIFG